MELTNKNNFNRVVDFKTAWQLKNPIFVDVRSESEYALDHIPGAINIPILNDAERVEVGTIYHNVTPKEARFIGLEIVSPKLVTMAKELEELSEKGTIILYCWRGGMRSTSISYILDLMRIPHYRILKGYKEYRQIVNEFFAECPFKVEVIHGLTGVGKTHIIKELQALGEQSIDLEGLAGNRGSAYGNVGLPPQPSQKMFESKLWYDLQACDRKRPIIVECESKRIGRLLLPDSLHQKMQCDGHILVFDSVQNRVNRIIEDYDPSLAKDEIIEATVRLKARLGKEVLDDILEKIELGDYKYVTEVLLVKYYDPLYKYPDEKSELYDASFDAASSRQAALAIKEFLTDKYKTFLPTEDNNIEN